MKKNIIVPLAVLMSLAGQVHAGEAHVVSHWPESQSYTPQTVPQDHPAGIGYTEDVLLKETPAGVGYTEDVLLKETPAGIGYTPERLQPKVNNFGPVEMQPVHEPVHDGSHFGPYEGVRTDEVRISVPQDEFERINRSNQLSAPIK